MTVKHTFCRPGAMRGTLLFFSLLPLSLGAQKKRKRSTVNKTETETTTEDKRGKKRRREKEKGKVERKDRCLTHSTSCASPGLKHETVWICLAQAFLLMILFRC